MNSQFPAARRKLLNLTERVILVMVGVLVLLTATAVMADDGYRLWLRYDSLPAEQADAYGKQVALIVAPGNSATMAATRKELSEACEAMLGRRVPISTGVDRGGAVVVGTPQSSSVIAELKLDRELRELGPEGFLIRSIEAGTHPATVIASTSEVGALYGAFHFLRLIQMLRPIDALNLTERPRLDRRVLNHWVGSSRVDLQACKLEYSIVSPK